VFSSVQTWLQADASMPHCNYIQEFDGEEPARSVWVNAAIT